LDELVGFVVQENPQDIDQVFVDDIQGDLVYSGQELKCSQDLVPVALVAVDG